MACQCFPQLTGTVYPPTRLSLFVLLVQIIQTEPCFLIHFANAYEEGDEVVLLTIGWGPELVREAASKASVGVFGSFSTGDYQLVPVTNLFSHR